MALRGYIVCQRERRREGLLIGTSENNHALALLQPHALVFLRIVKVADADKIHPVITRQRMLNIFQFAQQNPFKGTPLVI